MRTFSFMLSWVTASRTEALLARHRQIEEIDLLLGLLAQGGTVAQLLGRRGVSLETARRGA
ncbi:Clp protease N-terminal domain-containing protein [Actinomyces faecalis]|uniref:Clp protease N-terminal domain-containing protein n=1 Tax=Actinomyces faecalis TaxID=2722820 RepID=UPI001554EC2F|nr:Clp protease N-terminal domain-containing protein [Actinomyces faecalis]